MAEIKKPQHLFESLNSNPVINKTQQVKQDSSKPIINNNNQTQKSSIPAVSDKKVEKKPVFSAKDIEWFEDIIKSEFTFSPMKSIYLMSNNMKEQLKSELSISLLLKKLPLSFQGIPIIGSQLIDETLYWQEIFDHYLTLTPTFIFNNNKKDQIYLLDQCREFWNYLYIPLQEQYNVMLEDIITYNYSPFKIDINLFKK